MNKTLTTHVKERQENLQSKQGNLQSKQVRMEQLTEEQQKQVKKMSTARIRQRLIKVGFTEVGLYGLSREDLMNTLAEHMIKQEPSSSEEEEEEEEGAVGGAKVKKSPGQTVESDPLPTFVNPSMTMEGMMQMMMMMRQDEERRRQDEERRRLEEKKDEERRRREEKREQEEKE